MKTAKQLITWLIVALFALQCSPPLKAEPQKAAATAPVPSQIKTANKLFIGNGGDDPRFNDLGKGRAYNQFYSAMKDWAHCELVGSPAESDLIVQVRLASQLNQYGNELKAVPTLELVILDPKTHATLWTFTEELETSGIVGMRQDKKFDRAMDRIVEDLKSLVSSPAPPSAPKP